MKSNAIGWVPQYVGAPIRYLMTIKGECDAKCICTIQCLKLGVVAIVATKEHHCILLIFLGTNRCI